jgi:hypothetical protein
VVVSCCVECLGFRGAHLLCAARPVLSISVVRDLLVLALASPDAAADCARDAHAQTHRRRNDDKSDDDLNPQPLLACQILEQVAAAGALVRLPLVDDSLARRPHGALLDAAIDRRLGLLCGGGGQREAGLGVALERVHVEVCLALGRAAGVHGAAGLGVLVEGRVGVRRVDGHLLGCCVGGRRRHGGLGRGGRAQRGRWVRLGRARGSLDGDAEGDGLCHCDVGKECLTRGRTVCRA